MINDILSIGTFLNLLRARIELYSLVPKRFFLLVFDKIKLNLQSYHTCMEMQKTIYKMVSSVGRSYFYCILKTRF